MRRMEALRGTARPQAPRVVEVPVVTAPQNRGSADRLSGEARRMVEGRPEPDRDAIQKRGQRIHSDAEARSLVGTILGTPPASLRPSPGDRHRNPANSNHLHGGDPLRRLDPSEVGRTTRDREETVASFVNQFLGRSHPSQVGISSNFGSRPGARGYHDHGIHDHGVRLHEGNRRVVCYRNRESIPPILLATNHLHRVEVTTVGRSPYLFDQPGWVDNVPATYRQPDAYAVSYQVDPKSLVTRDDILFQRGSTAFADAYSFDIVADLAEAMLSPQLSSEEFVIEGHASAEGSYELNLELSQRRAERIARDLVAYGVDPARLVPVGYGETEARFPANAPESQRALDRRVLVFRME